MTVEFKMTAHSQSKKFFKLSKILFSFTVKNHLENHFKDKIEIIEKKE
jgi:hypothetical protein